MTVLQEESDLPHVKLHNFC